MKTRLSLLGASLCTVILYVAMSMNAKTEALDTPPIPAGLFEGKFVTIMLKAQRGTGHVLKDVRLEKIADRWVLLGEGIDTGQDGNWMKGLTYGISWDDVNSFYITTPTQYEELTESVQE